ncbi:MAG TPA: BTAD domain-containing putative transcriptional regulator, partial [Actinomycetota bacterium]|nr:BTAD domain-containing putative transcriptional regulator [Actinomycetota bacterium]
MDYRILGSLEVASNETTAELGPPKQRALLAILLLHANEIVPTERLIGLLWGDRPPRTAPHSIQIYVSELRKAIEPLAGGPVIVTRPPGYRLKADPESIDARRFERLVSEGARALKEGDPAAGVTTLRSALDLWHGPALSDFAYEEFAQADIRRLANLHLAAIEDLAEGELEAGRPQEVWPLVEAAIREDPLRERPRELLMLSLYRTGRHAEALRTFQMFRELLSEELGLDPSPALRRLQERILLHDLPLEPSPTEATANSAFGRNPYKGLRPFREDDALDFFGRESLVDRLLGALREGARLIALVGPSGSGKSSVAAAGLIPKLRAGAIPGSERWVIASMVPGQRPLEDLEVAIASAAERPSGMEALVDGDGPRPGPTLQVLPQDGRRLIVIDQFEEIFAVTDEDSRRRFLSDLAAAVTDPGGRLAVVLTLRADFYDRPLLHPEFAEVFTPAVTNVLPMPAQELERAVAAPADGVGVELEPALMAELIADTADQPGALPLLQFALTELFDQRTGPILTLAEYRALGGLRGALTRRAEELYGQLDEEEKRVALQVFLRLVRLGRGTGDSRRRVPVSELTGLDLDPVALSGVLERFGRHRLLFFDRDAATGDATVEAAHEALLWEWDRLVGWVDRHRAALRRHGSFVVAVEEWEASGRNADYLLTGNHLAEYEAWSTESTLELTRTEREFLAAGRERARPPDVALVWEGGSTYGGVINAGFDSAVEEFDLRAVKVSVSEIGLDPERRPLSEEVRRLSEEGIGLIVVASAAADVNTIAREFPDTRYAVNDSGPPNQPNVSYLSAAENEGSFLVGAAAALKSRTGRIGFIGGVDIPRIHQFQAGYEAGALAVDPNIEIRSTYLTPYFDFSGFVSP